MKNLLLLLVGLSLAVSAVSLSSQAATERQSNAKMTSSQLVKKLKMANLEGELYIQDKDNNLLDLGNLSLSASADKTNFSNHLKKMGLSLTNEGVVQDGKTFLAIVNQASEQTQYLYFTNVQGIEMGMFEIKDITTNKITIVMENADGSKEDAVVSKKVGTFLPY